jgi:hypothetical protein
VQQPRGPELLDDVIGTGFSVIACRSEILGAVSPQTRDRWEQLGGQMVVVGAEAPTGDALVDIDGVYTRWLDAAGAVAGIIRPDFYVFGMVRDAAELEPMLQALISDLGPALT